MRVRAHQRAAFAKKELERKAKNQKPGFSEDSDEVPKQNSDITKKDMTTDHNGKPIQVKQARADKLPSMMPSTTRQSVSQ